MKGNTPNAQQPDTSSTNSASPSSAISASSSTPSAPAATSAAATSSSTDTSKGAPVKLTPPPSATRKSSTRTKIITVVLALLALLLIGLIVYFVLRGAGIITTPVDLANVTVTSINEEVNDFKDLNLEEQEAASESLEEKVTAYAKQTATDKGEYDIDTIYANLAVFQFYINDSNEDEAVAFLQNLIASIEETETSGEELTEDALADMTEAKILYYLSLYYHYRGAKRTVPQIKTGNILLSEIPLSATMHYENWPLIRETIVDDLQNLSRKTNEGGE